MKQENRSFFTAAFTGTFFLLCTVILFSLLYLRPGQLDPEETLAPASQVERQQAAYEPTAQDDLTVLLVAETQPQRVYLISRMLVEEGRIQLYLLPEDLPFSTQGGLTAGEAYDYNGIKNLALALQQEYDLAIDRWVRVPGDSAAGAISLLGTLRLDLEEPVSFYGPEGELLGYEAGSYRLRGEQLSQMLAGIRYDDSSSVLAGGQILQQLLVQKLPQFWQRGGTELFSRLMDGLESDFSLRDFERCLPAAKYVLSQEGQPVEFYLISAQ